MRKHIFTLMALAAALCACNKEQMIESEVTNPETEPSAPLVFTATMEDAPESKATFDNAAECASWEVGDQISINGLLYKANAAGTSTTFSMVGSGPAHEIRPVFVSTTTPNSHDNNNPPSNLVDAAGTGTRWCAHTDHKVDGVWNIVVSTGSNTLLKTIKLWNADNSTYPNRRWKRIQLYGRSKTSDPWEIIGRYNNLNLAINNKGFAGEIEVNSSSAYTFYKIDVLDNEGDSYMQMSDMKFTVEPGEPYSAYFPANLYDGFTASLPSSVSETWVDGKFNMPMYAQSNTPDFQFKNLCGVLKITVKNDRISAIKSIRVSSANKAVSGAFTVENNTAVLTSPDETAKTLTVTYSDAVPTTAEGTVFYVAIPAQTYRELKIELSSDGKNYTKAMSTKDGADIDVARNKIYPINHVYVRPAGALPGVFTVNSQGKKVHFSKGNLQATYNGTTYTWDFAEHQYDSVGGAPGNTTIDSQSEGNVVDLFGWSTTSTFFGINTSTQNPQYSGNFVDWGTAVNDKGTWYTLSKDEWVYIFNTRSASTVSEVANARYAKAKVNNVNGLIILPDVYVHPSGVEALENINVPGAKYDKNILDTTSWLAMESAGAVFFPGSGFRYGSTVSNNPNGGNGYLWSSSKNDSYEAYCLSFYAGFDNIPGYPGLELNHTSSRHRGYSVRLVTEIK